jgi:hypothetical protein
MYHSKLVRLLKTVEMTDSNSLVIRAYYTTKLTMAVKSFMIQVPGRLSHVIYGQKTIITCLGLFQILA